MLEVVDKHLNPWAGVFGARILLIGQVAGLLTS
jgi:hypothetical protein